MLVQNILKATKKPALGYIWIGDDMKTRKFLLMPLSVVAFFYCSGLCQSQSTISIEKKLSSHYWQTASEAVAYIDKHPDSLGNIKVIREGIVNLFHRETEYFRSPQSGMMEKLSGETEGDVAFLIVKLDIKNAIPDLIDWVGNSYVFQNYIVTNVAKSDCDKSPIVDSLIERFKRTETYFEDRKNDYFALTCAILDSANGNCTKLMQTAKPLMTNALSSKNPFQRLRAIGCASFFTNDSIIVNRLQQIVKSDQYKTIKNGQTIFPIRNAAQNILSNLQKQ
jgi:hypothetical protein